jgi:ADP-ribosylglycohydrolase
MRVAPLAWLPGASREEVFSAAAAAGALTHGHPSGYLSGAVLAAIIRGLIDGLDLKASSYRALAMLRTDEPTSRANEVSAQVERALELAESEKTPVEAIASLGHGWVGEEALGVGLYAALSAENFMDAITRASNHDGDSDSTASIAGQIYGAMKMLPALPHYYIRHLDVYTEVRELVGRFFS